MENVNDYHGYLALPRHSKLLLKELGYDLFGFYLGLVMCAIWYRGNKNFGRIVKTQTELAESLHMTQTTVSRKFNELEKHKYFVIRHKRGMILGYFPLFLPDVAKKIHSSDYANLHELYSNMHQINAELQGNYANSQDERTQNKSLRFNSSSKDNFSFPNLNSEEVDVDEVIEGIERMKKERENSDEI